MRIQLRVPKNANCMRRKIQWATSDLWICFDVVLDELTLRELEDIRFLWFWVLYWRNPAQETTEIILKVWEEHARSQIKSKTAPHPLFSPQIPGPGHRGSKQNSCQNPRNPAATGRDSSVKSPCGYAQLPTIPKIEQLGGLQGQETQLLAQLTSPLLSTKAAPRKSRFSEASSLFPAHSHPCAAVHLPC